VLIWHYRLSSHIFAVAPNPVLKIAYIHPSFVLFEREFDHGRTDFLLRTLPIPPYYRYLGPGLGEVFVDRAKGNHSSQPPSLGTVGTGIDVLISATPQVQTPFPTLSLLPVLPIGLPWVVKSASASIVRRCSCPAPLRPSSTEHWNRRKTCSHEDMDVVWHQSPCETGCTGLGDDFSKSANKGITVFVIPEDLQPLNSADHNAVESARSIDASFSRHGRIVVIPVKSCQSIHQYPSQRGP
jgi:hypothetical protein